MRRPISTIFGLDASTYMSKPMTEISNDRYIVMVCVSFLVWVFCQFLKLVDCSTELLKPVAVVKDQLLKLGHGAVMCRDQLSAFILKLFYSNVYCFFLFHVHSSFSTFCV